MTVTDDFQENLWNRFKEMDDHIGYNYNRHGRVPKSIRLEVCTRKRNSKFAFKETVNVDDSLKAYIESRPDQQSYSSLQSPWQALYDEFLKLMRTTCKISLFAQNYSLACEAVRKISAINLVATFAPEEN